MSENGSKNSESFSEGKSVSSLAEMKPLVEVAFEPRAAGEKQPVLLSRAARRLGIKISRAKAFIYEEARRVDADEWREARAKAEPIIENLWSKIDWMERQDEAFYRPEIDRLKRILDQLGPRHSARTEFGFDD